MFKNRFFSLIFIFAIAVMAVAEIVNAAWAINLPKTGQIKMWGEGDDGELKKGVAWPKPRFTVDKTGNCVTDNLTGLMWVRYPDSTQRTWQEALDYANKLTLCGYSDWCLPNVNELKSIEESADNTNLGTPSVSKKILQVEYWSSNTYAYKTTAAWIVDTANRLNEQWKKTSTAYVRSVRSGKGGAPSNLPKTGQTKSYATGDDGELKKGVEWPSPRFAVDKTGDCVIDNLTGLMWPKNANLAGVTTWHGALNYANKLSLCGYSDWRLPNINELRSLINYGETNNAAWLNTQGFSNVQVGFLWWEPYWSSSRDTSTYVDTTRYELVYTSRRAYYVYMYDGSVNAYKGPYSNKTIIGYVWPVRGGK